MWPGLCSVQVGQGLPMMSELPNDVDNTVLGIVIAKLVKKRGKLQLLVKYTILWLGNTTGVCVCVCVCVCLYVCVYKNELYDVLQEHKKSVSSKTHPTTLLLVSAWLLPTPRESITTQALINFRNFTTVLVERGKGGTIKSLLIFQNSK